MRSDEWLVMLRGIRVRVRVGVSLVAQMGKNPPANAGDSNLIPDSGRSPGEGNSSSLQCSCLENPMARGAMAYSQSDSSAGS